MDTSFIDSPTRFNPLLSDSADVESDDDKDQAELTDKQKKRFNGIARRKVEDYIEMRRLEKQNQDFYFDID